MLSFPGPMFSCLSREHDVHPGSIELGMKLDLADNTLRLNAALFSSDAVYEDMTLRTQILGRPAIERYLGRALAKLPAGTGSLMLHVVGGDMGGGFEWQTAPAYRTTVRHGITAIALDAQGQVSRLTTLWDGAMLPLDEAKALAALSIE